jgi:hypothetical protein
MLIFTNPWSPSLRRGHRRNRWIGSARCKSTPGSLPGRPDHRRAAPVPWRGEQLRTANERFRTASALAPCENFHPTNGCDNCSAREISRANVVSVLSRQAAGIMSSGRRPGRTEVLLWRVPADNGPDGWRPKDQWPNPTTTIKLRNWSLPRKVWPDHPLRPSDPFPMP